MADDAYQWELGLIQNRYHFLTLTFDQAEELYKYEQNLNTSSDKSYFSPWEEWDYEKTTFIQILNQEQFKIYQVTLNEKILCHEKNLIEKDSQKTPEIKLEEDKLFFYENQFLPELLRDPFVLATGQLIEKNKTDYLKREYKRFLDDTKKEILVNHFRFNRSYCPNGLKIALLKHKADYVLPNYTLFKYWVDQSTRSIIKDLWPKCAHLPKETEQLITRKFAELQAFHQIRHQQLIANFKGTLYINKEKLGEEEKSERRTMILLLLDKSKYNI